MLTLQLRSAWIFKLKKFIYGSELWTLPNKRLVGTVDTLHSIWSVYLFSLVTYEVNTISYEQSQAQCQRINLEAEWNQFVDLGYVSSGSMKKYNFRTNHSITEAPPSNLNLRWPQSTFLLRSGDWNTGELSSSSKARKTLYTVGSPAIWTLSPFSIHLWSVRTCRTNELIGFQQYLRPKCEFLHQNIVQKWDESNTLPRGDGQVRHQSQTRFQSPRHDSSQFWSL